MSEFFGTITEDEYLLREPEAEYKSEYLNGRIVAMGGGSPAHSLITGNLYSEIHHQLKARPCRAYTADTRVKVTAAHFYTYPDISVVCGLPRFDSIDPSALLNPQVIVEVLSPSTEAYDRGEKFSYYKKLPSLQHYLLVAQDRIRVERFSCTDAGIWDVCRHEKPDDILSLPSIDCQVSIGDIYDKVW